MAQKRLTTIHIRDLKLKTIIGTKHSERKRKQGIVLNIKIVYDAASAIQKDDLKSALDYDAVTRRIIKFASKSRFFLLEKLADSMLSILMAEKSVREASIRIDKPKALRSSKSVSVELHSMR